MRGSIQKRGKESWRLVFDLDRDQTGRRRQKTVTFRGSKKKAEAELRQILAKIENGGFVEPDKLTVANYLENWLNFAATKTSAKTLERYTDICRNHLIPALGKHILQKIQSVHIQEHYLMSLKEGRFDGDGGLSAQTVLHHHRILRQALKQAVKWRLLINNPTDAVEPPKPERREIIWLDEDQTAALLQAAEGISLYMPILLAVTTGLRRGEILALAWRDVNLEQGVLSVTRSLEQTRDGMRFKTPKTKRSRRSLTLPLMTIEALQTHKAAQAALRLRLGAGRDDGALVCPGFNFGPRSPGAFTREFTRFVDTLDIPRITFHGLRHTHASQLLRAGVHPKIAQERLGHSTVAVTLDMYSHVVPSMQVDAAGRVDAILKTALGKQKSNE